MHYVVIEVEDDSKLDQLLEEDIPRLQSGIRTIGLFRVPTKFCDPSDGHRGRKTEAGWTRGKKYGWWVCGSCKKPSKMWGRNLNAVLSSTRNLLVGDHILGAAPPRTAREMGLVPQAESSS
jgi:hypothetical protein